MPQVVPAQVNASELRVALRCERRPVVGLPDRRDVVRLQHSCNPRGPEAANGLAALVAEHEGSGGFVMRTEWRCALPDRDFGYDCTGRCSRCPAAEGDLDDDADVRRATVEKARAAAGVRDDAELRGQHHPVAAVRQVVTRTRDGDRASGG